MKVQQRITLCWCGAYVVGSPRHDGGAGHNYHYYECSDQCRERLSPSVSPVEIELKGGRYLTIKQTNLLRYGCDTVDSSHIILVQTS